MKFPELLIGAFEVAANRLLQQDPDAIRRLDRLSGKVIEVQITGLDVSVYMMPNADSLQVMGEWHGAVDTTLKGSPVAFAQLGLGGDARKELLSGGISLEGDTLVGQQFQRLLTELNIDWEELLAQRVGDSAAYHVGKTVRGLRSFGRGVRNGLMQNFVEYTHHESEILPLRDEVDDFVDDVSELRDDVERLEQRLNRLVSRTEDV